MKVFIALSKLWRERYKKELPFIYAMAKLPMREDLKSEIDRYLQFKKQSIS